MVFSTAKPPKFSLASHATPDHYNSRETKTTSENTKDDNAYFLARQYIIRFWQHHSYYHGYICDKKVKERLSARRRNQLLRRLSSFVLRMR